MEEVEKKRQELKKRGTIILSISCIVMVVAILCMISFMIENKFLRDPEKWLGFGFGLISLSCFTWAAYDKGLRKMKKEFRQMYIESYVCHLFKESFDELSYTNSGLDMREIINNELLINSHIYQSYDRFEGVFEETPFKKGTVLIQKYTTNADGDSTKSNMFYGRYLYLYGLKNVESPVYITNSLLRSRIKASTTFKQSKYLQYTVEDEQFNKEYKVFCTNMEHASSIVTEELIAGLKTLKPGTGFGIYFDKTTRQVAINSGAAYYEPKVFKPIDEKRTNLVLKDIDYIKEMIRILK